MSALGLCQLLSLNLDWETHGGSAGGERRGRLSGGPAAQPSSLVSFPWGESYFWLIINLLLPAWGWGLLHKAVSARFLFILFSSLFWETGPGSQKAAWLGTSVLSVAAELFLETGESGHLTVVFIQET